MPRLKRKHTRSRREWTTGQIAQLATGWDFFGDGWSDPAHIPMDQRDNWPSPEADAEMRAAWSDVRDEILADQQKYAFARPWGWWRYEAEPALAAQYFAGYADRHHEAELLDSAGLLSPEALAAAAADDQMTRGIFNEAYEPAFRRSWGWWRFTSPQRRNQSVPEAVQLVDIERRGGEVLTGREKHLVEHKADDPIYAKLTGPSSVQLTAAECEALGLDGFTADELETT